ncbi:multiubiquitin domain-containing protein [Sphingomonas faeni]|uniref:multiubiquitin domain-containing protein n=1 Tax=Sphingomonas faeni TaxID=185950 RepID=UPI0027D8B95F|nr:multiubiquitin domain-containing protein [Sphingomonas faeni]
MTVGNQEEDPSGGKNAGSDCRAIVVNGRKCVVRSEDVGFDQVVRLAFGGEEPTHSRSMSVTYRRGPATAAEGILSHYQRIPLIDGEEFIVTRTDKS